MQASSERASRRHRLHLATAALFCVGLPVASWLHPSVGPAWAMFTTSTTYRFRITTTDASGRRSDLPPVMLSLAAAPSGTNLFAGAEAWQHGSLLTVPEHLDEIAQLACSVSHAQSAEVALDVRPTLHAAVQTRTARIRCP